MVANKSAEDGIGEINGLRAALFPALSEGSKEKRAVSILLACMEQVPEFAKSLLQGQGAPLSKKSRLTAWTEAGKVGQKDAPRPDGRIEVKGLRGQSWVALLEAKIGKAALRTDQIGSYLDECRVSHADALITISNDFAVLTDHHPTYQGKIPKGVNLLHWSWSSILTKCRLLSEGDEIEDRDHKWVIDHLARFLSHPSTGVTRFDRMPASWKEISDSIATGASIRGSAAALEVAAAWIQETRDLGLRLTELLQNPVPVKLTRPEKDDPGLLTNRVLDRLCTEQLLHIEYLIPDSVSPLKVIADLRGKTFSIGMTTNVAEDRKTTKARVNWLLRQLKRTQDSAVHIRAIYGRSRNVQFSLERVREDPDILANSNPKILPRQFEVKLIVDVGRRMAGAKTFVQTLEDLVIRFYDEAGQYLRPWVPRAPKVTKRDIDIDKGIEVETRLSSSSTGISVLPDEPEAVQSSSE